ncbi:hypothetical protein [Patulibacter minatonensis]|uniref:hypothetical protein n=1 Tax=Patulibacter minatonensis TaxID=298163 RepID=UPI00047DAFCC|nr:hypothetical protein [Patulibacter minatonensis]
MTAADPDPHEPAQQGARREIEPTADAVVEQLRRLEAAWRFDMTPAAAEIDAVARAVDGLRGAIERASRSTDESDDVDLDELLRTREQLAEAMALAERFLRMLAADGPVDPSG